MRVALFSDATYWGGAEVSLSNLCRTVDPRVDVVVLGVDRTIGERIASTRPGAEVVVLPSGEGAGWRVLASLRRHIADVRADVFHANLRAPWAGQKELLVASTIRGLATVAVEQLVLPVPSVRSRAVMRTVAPRVDVHVAVSAHDLDEVRRLGRGRTEVVRNGVPDRPELATPVRPAGRTVGTLAALVPRKGLDVLLRAVADIDDTQLLVVGKGTERDRLHALAAELDLSERVRFHEDASDARALLSEMDVFVLPSWQEGFPLSVVEAMLAARPVVATAVGGVPEAIVHGETGYLVPPGSVGGLAAAITSLLGHPDRRAQMGSAARARALGLFTAAEMARTYEGIWKGLI